MAGSISVLDEADAGALVRFLESRADASLLMLAGLRTYGIRDEGKPGQATYVGLRSGGDIHAVVAHLTNGRMLFQAPERGPDLALAAQAATARPVMGMFGPWAQLTDVRQAFGLDSAPIGMDSHEDLLAVQLDALRIPEALQTGRVRCRRARPEEQGALAQMRFDFWVEGMKEKASSALERSAQAAVAANLRDGTLFILEDTSGNPVSTCMFTAVLPDAVQIGGVWTPNSHRNRGYAGAVVAGALALAKAEGKRRAVLFTGKVNHPAQIVYRRLGFAPVGDYGVLLFHEGQTLRAAPV